MLAVVSVVGYLQLARLALLGGDKDYTVGGTGTVDGCGSGVFQHIDGFDVGGVQVVQVATGNAVDYVQRVRIARSAQTADVHLEAFACLTVILHNGDTGRLALHGSQCRGGGEFLNVVALHLHRGTGDKFLFLYAIAHNHYVVQ